MNVVKLSKIRTDGHQQSENFKQIGNAKTIVQILHNVIG